MSKYLQRLNYACQRMLLLGALALLTALASSPLLPSAVLAAPAVIAPEIPSRGSPAAPVVLTVVSEFQCPFCSRLNQTLVALEKANPGKVRLLFVHFPLDFHAHAAPAALWAQAAHRQGLFWPMHDQLFARQRSLGDDAFAEAAGAAGLDAVVARRDLADPRLMAHVQADAQAMQALGVRGTPMTFINGVQLGGAQPLEKFQAAVDAALQDPPKTGETAVQHWERRQPGIGGKLAQWLADRQPFAAIALPPEEEVEAEKPPSAIPTVWQVPVDPSVDAIRGDGPDIELTAVVWTDVQCPFCSRFAKTLAELSARYPGKLRIVLKHNPLPFHKMAPAAHKAMMAAGKQAKFWEFHDALFERSGALEEEVLREIAQKLGLDQARWERDRQDPALAARIDADLRSGQSAGVDGTPSMFLNGRRIVGAVPLQDLVDVAEQELKRARAAGWKGHTGYLKAIAGGQVRPAAAEPARPQPAVLPKK